jgi:hypothetical protein
MPQNSKALSDIAYINARYKAESYKKFTAHMLITAVEFLRQVNLSAEGATAATLCDALDADWKPAQ